MEIIDIKTNKTVATLDLVDPNVATIKAKLASIRSMEANRIEIRTQPKGKALADDCVVEELVLYTKDRGPQIGWSTVFYLEYLGPLIIYSVVFGVSVAKSRPTSLQWICWAAWSGHYIKRLAETKFVHRFSNATMPLANLWRNSGYYWTAGLAIAVEVHLWSGDHVHTTGRLYWGLAMFVLCELGNGAIHLHLRSLRPEGSTIRNVPQPDVANPFTLMFHLVSCPNYTYELGSWMAFYVMSGSWAALLFCIGGGIQMAVWAKTKHANYRKENKDYPIHRRAMIPLLF